MLPKFKGVSEDTEEFTLEHMKLHKNFCAIFEEKVEDFITEQGISIKEFYGKVAIEMEGAQVDGSAGTADKLLKFVHQASDFKVWFKSMCQLSVLTEVGYTCTKSATGEFHR